MLSSEFIVERLVGLGVRHVFGVGGANIEDLFSAVQKRRPQLQAILCKHEHGAGTAADAYARIRGLGVVMATSGGGAMNLVHSLAEARASHSPVLALVGEPPLELQGRGAFQDTSGKGDALDAYAVFDAVTSRCFRVPSAAQLPELLDVALEAVLDRQGPAVLLLAKDVQRAELSATRSEAAARRRSTPALPSDAELERAAAWLDSSPIVILAGSGVARASAQDELAAFAERIGAAVATTPDGRDAFDNRHARFRGVVGAMGHADVTRSLDGARLVVAVGTRLPLLARQGVEGALRERRLLVLGHDPPFVAGLETLHLAGALPITLRALVAQLERAAPGHLAARRDPAPEKAPNVGVASAESLASASALAAIDGVIPDGSTVLVDAGNTGATSIHYARAPRRGRWLVAMGMAGMGWAFGAATGAALATGERCFVLAGDGAFFMHGMEIHTALQHSLPITYVVFNNRAHGMCLVRERLLLGENAGYNAFRASHIGAGLQAMFPGLPAADCTTRSELESLLSRAKTNDGPSVIAVELDEVEVPPFTLFRGLAAAARCVTKEADHG